MESLPGQYWAIFDVFDGERIGLYNIYIYHQFVGGYPAKIEDEPPKSS